MQKIGAEFNRFGEMASRLAVIVAMAGLACGAAPVAAQDAQAPQARAVIELFTSQGCSSCPPADKIFGELAADPKVIALSMPVDYWDYLGWKDTLASPVFSERQRAYAMGRGDRAVYTPQAVVNGVTHILGSDRAAIDRAVPQRPLPVGVAIEEGAGGLARVRVTPPAGVTQAGVWLVPVSHAASVTIERGENRGRSITYANVARGLIKLGVLGAAPASFDIPAGSVAKAGGDGFVVLVQAENGKPGPILGAACSRSLHPPI